MYTNPQNGQHTVAAVAPTLHHGTYRRAIMAVLSADCFTPAERVLANHNVYECQDGAKLALWLKNVRRVAAEREAATQAQALANMAHGIERFETRLTKAAQPAATAAQTSEIHKLSLHRAISKGERTLALDKLPCLTEAQATALIGELWAKILLRTGSGGTGPNAESVSYFSAA